MNEMNGRPTAHEIFESVAMNAREELKRPSKALAFSGLAAGLTMGLTGMGVAIARAHLGPGNVQELLAMAMYPLGFIAVIVGRAQLFTENTLYPVVLVLDEHKHLVNMLRLWAVVLASNIVGALLFALLAVKTSALRPEYADALTRMGTAAAQRPFTTILASGIVGGWLIALVAWLVSGSRFTIAQVAVVWLFTFLVGAGNFAHCIAGSSEILAAVLRGSVSMAQFASWFVAATLGNIIGGIVIVALLNYGQVAAGQTEPVLAGKRKRAA